MKKNRRMYRLFIIIPILFLMTIGFASIVISSDFHGESRFGANAFNAYFDNVYDSFNSSFFVNLFSLSNNNRTLTVTPTFENVSDEYIVYADIRNDSDFAIIIKSVEIDMDEALVPMIDSSVIYKYNGVSVGNRDVIQPHSSLPIRIIFRFRPNNNLSESNLNLGYITKPITINFTFNNLNQAYINDYYYGVHQTTDYLTSDVLTYTGAAESSEYSGLYLYAPTKDDEHPIYFYRGGREVKNNVVFAGFCWKIIRTTSNGNVKLLYNGTPSSNGYCLADKNAAANTNIYSDKYTYLTSVSSSYFTNAFNMTKINNWYVDNLLEYDEYIEDEPFCESSVPSGGLKPEDINYNCNNGHSFSVATGELTYPMAGVDIMELVIAGLDPAHQSTTYKSPASYLWFNQGDSYYVMGNYHTSYSITFLEFSNYEMYDTNFGSYFLAYFRPVIHVKDNIFNYGTGNSYDPYRMEAGGD